MTNHSLLNETIKNLYESTPDYVHSVGYGYKFISGKFTDQLSIKFKVDKKLPISEIPDGEILPKNITVDGVEIATDVVESKRKKHMGSCWNYIRDNYVYGENKYLDDVKSRQRPLKGGVSVGNFAGSMVLLDPDNNPIDILDSDTYVWVGGGTLGAIVVDNYDNSLVGLTNAHVLAGRDYWEYSKTDNYNQEITTPYGIAGDIYNKRTYNISDDILVKNIYGQDFVYPQNMYQPSELDILEADNIGRPKRYVANSIYEANYIDAGLVSIKKSELDEVKSKRLYGFPDNIVARQKGFPFATTQEINSILTGDQRLNSLFSVGRTTGPKGSIAGCNQLKLIGIHEYAEVEDFDYYDLLEYAYIDYSPYPIDGGDSGSVVVAPFGDPNSPVYKIIGLAFAGDDYVGDACRIDRVASGLNISAFTGSGYNDSSLMKVTRFISGSKSNKISGFLCSGITGNFWQAGLAYNSNSVSVNNTIIDNTDSQNCKQLDIQ
jgi:hypothetical protein